MIRIATKPYGFALLAQGRNLQPGGIVSKKAIGDAKTVSIGGVTLVTRPYATTPEAMAEEQPRLEPKRLLAYQGRVDNRGDVAFALGKPELAHASDGAVLAAAHEAWGASLSAKVLGEFAYVVFDRDDAQIVAGQDSMGVRRIYYRASRDQVWIASDLRLLFEQFPEARPSFDPETLPEYFTGVMQPWSGRTIWRGIRELGRGCVLVMRGDVLEERVVWRPDPGRRFHFRDTDECDEAFRTVLFQAVAAALRTTGPILCDLSGGYDSSTVCAVASKLARTGASSSAPLIGWAHQNEGSDESDFREAVRSESGIESHVIEMQDHLPFRVFSDAEIPSLGLVQVDTAYEAVRSFAQARGIRTRLTGHGADALFHKGFAPNYLGDWLRAGRLLDWGRDFSAFVRSGRYSIWHLLRDCTVGSLKMGAERARLPLPNWLSPRFRRAMEESEYEFYGRRERVFPSTARELIYRCTLLFIPPQHSLLPDERKPLVYRPLVELMLGLDWEHIVRPGEDRVVMRRALRHILPEIFRTRRAKTAHFAAVYAGLRANWPRISHLVSGERLAELGVVEPKLFREAVNRMRAGHPGPGRNAPISITALYLETWMNLTVGQCSSAERVSAAG